MPEETDFKKAYEILDEATKEAVRILQKARLRVSLLAQNNLPPEDEADTEAAAFPDSQKGRT